MPPYQWHWEWSAKTQVYPDAAKINDFIRSKVAEKLVDEYTKRGFSITVYSVETSSTIKTITRPIPRGGTLTEYFVKAVTITSFDTNAPVFGSPIAETTVAVIVALLTFIISAATLAFKFYMFQTAVNMITDMGEGIAEALKTPAGAGLFVVIIVLGIMVLVGLFLWRGRRKH